MVPPVRSEYFMSGQRVRIKNRTLPLLALVHAGVHDVNSYLILVQFGWLPMFECDTPCLLFSVNTSPMYSHWFTH